MEEKIYTITLGDGTIIGNLRLNGNNFISETEIDSSIFEGNLNIVHINDGENDEIHENMDLVQNVKMGDEWWFILRDFSKSEIENARLRSDVDFIAMMTDIEI